MRAIIDDDGHDDEGRKVRRMHASSPIVIFSEIY